MTFAIFILLALGLFVALLNVLPTLAVGTVATYAAGFNTIVGYMKFFDYLFPIHELLGLVLVMITFEVIVWIWHVSWKVIKFVRGYHGGA